MITTAEHPPSPALVPFVRCYSFREFDSNGVDIVKTWHASHEVSVCFHFKDLPDKLVNLKTGQVINKGSYGSLLGLGTQYNGEMTFNGCFSLFEIIFKPNGFHKIFGLPCGEMNNLIISVDQLPVNGMKILYEQLCLANGLKSKAKIADAYLLSYVKKDKSIRVDDAITSMSNIILKASGMINIDTLAYNANMSKRTFERRFIHEVGVPPKLFCSVTRFNHALTLKLKNPKKSWTSIVFESGYFDQMHLIKDFKRFSGDVPSVFLKQTPLTQENYTSRVEV